MKAKQAIDNIEVRDPIDRRRYQGFAKPFLIWEEQEQKNSARWFMLSDMFEELQKATQTQIVMAVCVLP